MRLSGKRANVTGTRGVDMACRLLFVGVFASILLAAPAPLLAQWPAHATPGVPRTPDGKPDLTAPAPRTADGKPDLSGVWQVRQGSYLVYVTSDLKPEEILPWAAAAYKKSADNFRRDSDGIRCLPPGPKAGISGLAFPMKIVQTPNLVVVLYQSTRRSSGRSFWTVAPCRLIPIRRGWVIQSAIGKATRSSSPPPATTTRRRSILEGIRIRNRCG